MWFSLFALVLVLAVTFYQGLLGLFSAAMNCFLTLLAAALAFGLYEDVYFGYLINNQPDDGRAIALMSIFIISLLLMRVIVDLLVKDNMKFPVYLDRGLGGVFGLVTALVTIGTMCVAIQMLPFPAQWLGFARYVMYKADDGTPVDLDPKDDKQTEADVLGQVDLTKTKFVRKNLWLSPDAFAIAAVSHLSENALTGGNSLGRLDPELLDSIWWARFNSKGQTTTMARKQDAVQVEACWQLGEDDLMVLRPTQTKEHYKLAPPSEASEELPSGYRWLAVRAKLTDAAADDGKNGFRFTTRQVRLITRGKGGRTKVYSLIGINLPAEAVSNAPGSRRADYHYRLAEGETIDYTVGRFDFVFEVPEDEEPWILEFRRNARAEVREIAKEAPESISTPAKTGKKTGKTDAKNGRTGPKNDQTGENPDAPDGRAGRVARVHSNLEGCFFGDELPFELTSYTGDGLEHQGDKITNGRLLVKLGSGDEPAKGSEAPLKRLNVAPDKRLLHLSVTRLQPGSLYGQVKDFAGQNKNVYVKDANGKKHAAVGIYAIATVGRDRMFELHFLDETSRMSGAGIPKLDKMRQDNLRNKYELYYLFEVPPGARIEAFINPNGKEESYRSIELIAPQ